MKRSLAAVVAAFVLLLAGGSFSAAQQPGAEKDKIEQLQKEIDKLRLEKKKLEKELLETNTQLERMRQAEQEARHQAEKQLRLAEKAALEAEKERREANADLERARQAAEKRFRETEKAAFEAEKRAQDEAKRALEKLEKSNKLIQDIFKDIAEPKPNTAQKAVVLSRVTYSLPRGKARELAILFKSMKTPVVETKIDGNSLVVTTTPEAQRVIGEFIGLFAAPPPVADKKRP